jgi:hypothetical protein
MMLPATVTDLLPGLADDVAALAPILALPDDWTVSALVDVGNGMCYLRATAQPSTFVAEVARVAEVLPASLART